ncbi:hypothetical protein F5Y02DRAFT_381175 [Annulohypoxylon stygium]|nr:hypothetical protein F5Y02DRAFT_381175 [Annulohypoxylon stygium]
MLCGSSLGLMKKLASSIVTGAEIFVLVCAMLKTIFVATVSLAVISQDGTKIPISPLYS